MVQAVDPSIKVAFRPNAGPQEDFLAASEMICLYGGAAGGGKSYAILADPLRDVHNPNFKGLLVRKTTEELRDLIAESKKLYKSIFPKAVWKERDKTWEFPSGATLWFSYLDRDEDLLRYQGQQFTWVGFDELTQWPTPYSFNYLLSRIRTTDRTLSLSLRATTNPGGPGAWWVKKMFIDPAPAGEAFWQVDVETGEVLVDLDKTVFDKPNPNYGKPLHKCKFIPAKLQDNPYLTEDDSYRRQLMAMPEHRRRQLLYGDWDSAEGAAFPEWRRDMHTCEPFPIPRDWKRFRACDYGYGSHSSVLWFAIHPSGQLFVYRDLYVSKRLAVDLADDVIELDKEDGGVHYGVLDSSMWHSRGEMGPSMAEKMIRRGCRWRPSDRSKGSRIAGKNEIHRLLKYDEYFDGPGLIVFNTCKSFLAHFPGIPLDRKNSEDVDTHFPHDHVYDALRYGVMSRPRPHQEGGQFIQAPAWEPFDSILGY